MSGLFVSVSRRAATVQLQLIWATGGSMCNVCVCELMHAMMMTLLLYVAASLPDSESPSNHA